MRVVMVVQVGGGPQALIPGRHWPPECYSRLAPRISSPANRCRGLYGDFGNAPKGWLIPHTRTFDFPHSLPNRAVPKIQFRLASLGRISESLPFPCSDSSASKPLKAYAASSFLNSNLDQRTRRNTQ